MASFVGHGVLKQFSREIALGEPRPLGELLKGLSIPPDLLAIVVPVKGTGILQAGDLFSENDVIQSFPCAFGGIVSGGLMPEKALI
ncbi:MAG: hypothetical protein ACUVSK_06050 [Desulfotomaculales bacterium]